MLSPAVFKNKFNYYLKYIPVSVKVQLTDRNILKGVDDYNKFIILGRTRTGSNLMMTSLNVHKNLLAYGEIFNRRNVSNWDIPAGYRNRGDFELLKTKPVEFIENRIFRKYPRQLKAVGFKIFYFHVQEESKDSVWSFLKKNAGIKIIHMKRKNILRAHLSHKVAAGTKKFVNTMNTGAPDIKVTLDYEECLKDFEYTRDMENKYDILFTGHEKIDVFYENLHSGFQVEMERVQNFLGVNPIVIKPQIFKQSKKKLFEVITNYRELKEKCRGTEWDGFFED